MNPERHCISFSQLLEVAEDAKKKFGSEGYPLATMRDVCDAIIVPCCVEEGGISYAQHLNPGGLEKVDIFVSHSWDGQFAAFIEAIGGAIRLASSHNSNPSLWICAFALAQAKDTTNTSIVQIVTTCPLIGADQSSVQGFGLEQSPFVQALSVATTFCVVRNSQKDIYSRIWCVCELMYAREHGLFPDHTIVTGPDLFAHVRTSCLDAQASLIEDRERILRVLLIQHDREDIDNLINLFRTSQSMTGETTHNNASPATTSKEVTTSKKIVYKRESPTEQHETGLEPGRFIRYAAYDEEEDNPVTVRQWANLIGTGSYKVAKDFVEILRSCPYRGMYLETKGISSHSADQVQFEFVLVEGDWLADHCEEEANPFVFQKHFNASTDIYATQFWNLGRRSLLIAPKKCDKQINDKSYSHLAAFVREAPADQVLQVLRRVGVAYGNMLQTRPPDSPVWLSTCGGGVAWLTFRLDDEPKYYLYKPFARVERPELGL